MTDWLVRNLRLHSHCCRSKVDDYKNCPMLPNNNTRFLATHSLCWVNTAAGIKQRNRPEFVSLSSCYVALELLQPARKHMGKGELTYRSTHYYYRHRQSKKGTLIPPLLIWLQLPPSIFGSQKTPPVTKNSIHGKNLEANERAGKWTEWFALKNLFLLTI